MLTEGMVSKYYQGAVKNFLIIFNSKEPGRQKQLIIFAYASFVENIESYKK